MTDFTPAPPPKVKVHNWDIPQGLYKTHLEPEISACCLICPAQLRLPSRCSHTHTQTHTHTHKHSHTHARTHTHAHTHKHTHTNIRTHTHTHTHTKHSHTHAHTYTQTHTHTHTQTFAHTHACTSSTDTCTRTDINTSACTRVILRVKVFSVMFRARTTLDYREQCFGGQTQSLIAARC